MDDDPDDVEVVRGHVHNVLPDAVIDAKTLAFAEPHDYLQYDLIVMDERIGPYHGSEICALIRRLGYTKGVILISGWGQVLKNFDRFVNKDDMEQLEIAIDDLVRKSPERKARIARRRR